MFCHEVKKKNYHWRSIGIVTKEMVSYIFTGMYMYVICENIVTGHFF